MNAETNEVKKNRFVHLGKEHNLKKSLFKSIERLTAKYICVKITRSEQRRKSVALLGGEEAMNLEKEKEDFQKRKKMGVKAKRVKL